MDTRYRIPVFDQEKGLPEFVVELRQLVFSSPTEAAKFFGKSHTTTARYERDIDANDYTPAPPDYLAALAQVLIDRFPQNDSDVDILKDQLIQELNNVLYHCHSSQYFFEQWEDIKRVGATFRERQRKQTKKLFATNNETGIQISTERQQESINSSSESRASMFHNSDSAEIVDKLSPHLDRGTSDHRHTDWGEAPDTAFFLGRDTARSTLLTWIVDERCRVVGIIGMGGIGKTMLAAKIAKELAHEFEYIFWRSLVNAPPPEMLLADCIRFLSDQQQTPSAEPLDQQRLSLLAYLRKYRCLLIFDNMETILQGTQRAGEYRDGYTAYGDLIRMIGDTDHRSCLIVTSREHPKELLSLQQAVKTAGMVQVYTLQGIDVAEAHQFLQAIDLEPTADELNILLHCCSGNPKILEIVAASVRANYGGSVTTFLENEPIVSGDFREIMRQEFCRLSVQEQEVIYWLAIERQPITPGVLRKQIVDPDIRLRVSDILTMLWSRSLIEKNQGVYFLQNAIMEYITDDLVHRVSHEILTKEIRILQSHPLIKAQAKEYIRQSQSRLILGSVAERLSARLGKPAVERQIKDILAILRAQYAHKPGYVGGNLLNLLVYVQSDLSQYDFSHLAIWQAYLRGIHCQRINFMHADLTGTTFTESFAGILSLAFSSGETLLAAGDRKGNIFIWEIASGNLLTLFRENTAWVRTIAFAPDGRILASGSGDQQIRLWDISTSHCIRTLTGHSNVVTAVAFSPDGRYLLSGNRDHTVRLWDIELGCCLRSFTDHADWVTDVAFSANGQWFASSSLDRTVRIWVISSGACYQILSHPSAILTVTCHPDEALVASGTADGTVHIWEVVTGTCIQHIEGSSRVHIVAFHPNGRILAKCVGAFTYLFDIHEERLVKTLHGHDREISSLHFSPDGHFLSTADEEGVIRLWDTSNWHCMMTLHGYSNQIWSIAFSPDGKWLASGGDKWVSGLWNVTTGERYTLTKYTQRVHSVRFSADGQWLAGVDENSIVYVWNLNMRNSFHTIYTNEYKIYSVALNPDGTLLATCSGDLGKGVIIWEVATRQIKKQLQCHTDAIEEVIFSPDGKFLASCGDDRTVQIWNMETDRHMFSLQGHTHWVWCIAFSPDGKLLASSSEDQTVRLWDVQTGACIDVFHEHKDRVRAVCFSADGNILISGGEDSLICFWSLATRRLIRKTSHHGPIMSIACSPCAPLLASAGHEGIIHQWDIHTGECIRSFRTEKPYEGMKITGATGVTAAQRAALIALGAVEDTAQEHYADW